MPRPGPHQRVVERGADVNQDQRRGKDGATDDLRGRPARGYDDKISRAGNGQRRADAMGDGVGQNVAQMVGCLLGLHRLMIARGRCGLLCR